MAAARENWPDTRLDDMSRRMDAGFNRVDAELQAVDARMDAGFARVGDRFDAFQRTMLQIGGGVIAALLGLLGALVGVIATQI
jgi:hypothetical protein